MKMKTLCLILLFALSVPGCSRFTKTGRMDRAYYKQLKMASADREKRRKALIVRQRAQMPPLRDTPQPTEVPIVQMTTESQ